MGTAGRRCSVVGPGSIPGRLCYAHTGSSAASQKLQLHTDMASPHYERNNTSLCDVAWLCATEWCDNYCTLMCFQFTCILFLYYCWLAFIEAVHSGHQQRTAFALNTLAACLYDPICQGSGEGAVVFTPVEFRLNAAVPLNGDQLFVSFLSKCDIITQALETSKLRLCNVIGGRGWETSGDRMCWRMFRCGTSCCAWGVSGTAVRGQLRSAGLLTVLSLAAWLCSLSLSLTHMQDVRFACHHGTRVPE